MAGDMARVERENSIPGVRIGTSAFTAAGWEGSFYPPGLPTRDYLSYYATKFNSVMGSVGFQPYQIDAVRTRLRKMEQPGVEQRSVNGD